jgi:acetylxylan esterase
MRGLFTATFGMLAALATADITCAPGLYILIARGSGEPAAGTPVPKQGITLPPFTGSIGVVGELVASQLNGTVVAGVNYPAINPLPSTDNETTINPSDFKSLNLTDYYSSVNNGTSSIIDEVNQYHKACPDGKIALIGYSQVCSSTLNNMASATGQC